MTSKPAILIVGSPRSGTTWLVKIFDSNEHVLYRHEPDASLFCKQLPYIPELDSAGSLDDVALEYLRALLNVGTVKAAGSLPVFQKTYRSAISNKLYPSIVLAYKGLDTALRKCGFTPELRIPDLIKGRSKLELSVVIKSVDSLCRAHIFSVAEPSLRIVHIIRHPCGFVASQLRGAELKLLTGHTFLEGQVSMCQARRRGFDLKYLQSLSVEEQLASLWMLQNEKVMEEMKGSSHYKMVVYENLCASPPSAVKELFEFAGLDCSAQVDSFIAGSQTKASEKESYYQISRNPLESVNKWRKQLSAQQIDRIANIVGESAPGRLFSYAIG